MIHYFTFVSSHYLTLPRTKRLASWPAECSSIRLELVLGLCCERDQALSSSFCTSTVQSLEIVQHADSFHSGRATGAMLYVRSLARGTGLKHILHGYGRHNHIYYCRSFHIPNIWISSGKLSLPVDLASTRLPRFARFPIRNYILPGRHPEKILHFPSSHCWCTLVQVSSVSYS